MSIQENYDEIEKNTQRAVQVMLDTAGLETLGHASGVEDVDLVPDLNGVDSS